MSRLRLPVGEEDDGGPGRDGDVEPVALSSLKLYRDSVEFYVVVKFFLE